MNKFKKYLPFTLLIIASIIAITRSFNAAMKIEINIFTFWILTPYFITGIIYYFLIRQQILISLIISSSIILILTILSYADISSSSTAALVFVTAPFFLLIAGPLLTFLFYFLEKKIKQKYQ